MKHGSFCKPEKADEDLYIAGFVCKGYITLNTSRFSRDCLTDGNPNHLSTLTAVIDHIRVRRPKFYILENATGLKLGPQPIAQRVPCATWLRPRLN